MNRRDLFKLLGAATVASVGGIALIDTRKTFFLPPQGGWHGLRIRHAKQYSIEHNDTLYRYDAAWVTPSGEHKQYCIDATARCDDAARDVMRQRMARDHGSPNSSHYLLSLPRNFESGYLYA